MHHLSIEQRPHVRMAHPPAPTERGRRGAAARAQCVPTHRVAAQAMKARFHAHPRGFISMLLDAALVCATLVNRTSISRKKKRRHRGPLQLREVFCGATLVRFAAFAQTSACQGRPWEAQGSAPARPPLPTGPRGWAFAVPHCQCGTRSRWHRQWTHEIDTKRL